VARIPNKREFYRLWRAGLLGNRPRTWPTYEALLASGYVGTVTIRSVGAAGGKTRYRVPLAEVPEYLKTWVGTPTFNESAPDDMLVIQGEVMRSETGLVLAYDTTPDMPMNVARHQFRTAGPLYAKLLLDHHLSPASRDDLNAIWDLYPDAVIEFSTYSVKVGDQPHRNTLIWEVRDY
jgi:hypothetical protein